MSVAFRASCKLLFWAALAMGVRAAAARPPASPLTSTSSRPSTASAPPVSTLAAASGRAKATDGPYEIPYEKYVLANGLEIILHQDESLPLVAVNLWYHVGPVNEPPGRSGFAHLFEHLMFEGSKHVGHDFDTLLESAGATNVNGTTSWDRTNYFETVPSEYLELALWLESDRMGFMLDTLSRERLDVQRDVVKNERRQRYENAPYGPSDLAMFELLFPKGHAYHGAIIGSMEDLSRANLSDVRAFFESFYTPSNATLVIAGDLDPKTKEWVSKYFETLPSTKKPEASVAPASALTRDQHAHVRENVQVARLQMAWLTPPAYSEADVVLDVVARLLAGGKATRLYQDLVVDKRLSPDVSVWLDSNQVTSIFSVEAPAAAKAKPQDIEQAIDAALSALAKDGPSEDELRRAKNGIGLDLRTSLQLLNGGGGESGRAGILQRLNHYLADPGALPRYITQLESVSRDDVCRVVSTHLHGARRAVVITVPSQEADKEQGE